jgi:hypothetical protein
MTRCFPQQSSHLQHLLYSTPPVCQIRMYCPYCYYYYQHHYLHLCCYYVLVVVLRSRLFSMFINDLRDAIN